MELHSRTTSLLIISRYFPFSWSCPCHSSNQKPPISRTVLSPGPSSRRIERRERERETTKAAVFGSALLELWLHPVGEECPLPLSLDFCSFPLPATLLLLPLLQRIACRLEKGVKKNQGLSSTLRASGVSSSAP